MRSGCRVARLDANLSQLFVRLAWMRSSRYNGTESMRSSAANKNPRRSKPVTEFTNIRVLPSGYQVCVTRAKIEFSRHFAGHSDASLKAALRFRDKALRELPKKRLNPVPRKVLAALGLDAEVVGVFRHPRRSFYQVSFREGGRWRARTFSWKTVNEADAYAAAIAFRASVVRASS